MYVDPIFIVMGIGLPILLIVLHKFTPKLIKLEPHEALVRTRAVSVPVYGPKGVDVFFDTAYVLPAYDNWNIVDLSIKTIKIVRTGREGIHCRDNLRADMGVTFQVEIPKFEDNILQVAGSVGCESASEPQVLENLFVAKFAGAVKLIAKKLDFEELCAKRDHFNDAVAEAIGMDLNGYTLMDVDLDHLEQTPLEALDPDNILDAEAITKITKRTSAQHVETNRLRRTAEKTVAIEDHEHKEKLKQEQLKQTEQPTLTSH